METKLTRRKMEGTKLKLDYPNLLELVVVLLYSELMLLLLISGIFLSNIYKSKYQWQERHSNDLNRVCGHSQVASRCGSWALLRQIKVPCNIP